MTFRILILGGTTEARRLAAAISQDRRFDASVSLAGRTANPVRHATPVRTGGFGGSDGLAAFLTDTAVDVLIDATHPFAATISRNALKAASDSGVHLVALRRREWQAEPGDTWTHYPDITGAIAALGSAPHRVFVTLGRQELSPLLSAPQHHYLVRSVDPVDPPLAIESVTYVLDRGPFELKNEVALLKDHRIEAVVTKNSGGEASRAKLIAARNMSIPVYMIDRPVMADFPAVETVDEALLALDHWALSEQKRGV